MTRPLLLAIAVALAACGGESACAQPLAPFETEEWSAPESDLDQLVLAGVRAHDLQPAYPCSDEVFLRRVYLDVIGALPEPGAVRAFVQDDRPDKRAVLIEELLAREECAQLRALKWADLLRVKAEFPINLWPNAVQAYHRWIYESVRENRPYDQFARELLTASGSNFRVPPVNFYRAVQSREPAGLAEAVALTFMGVRLANWPEQRRADLAAFFSRVAYKPTDEWKEEIVGLNLAATEPLNVTFPDGTTATIAPGEDPRVAFADWLITPENPWFARAIANRVWSWFLGRGIVHEPDDFRDDNPPVNPELLDYLAAELVGADWDLRHLYRLILNSRTYQQSSIARDGRPEAETLFACYPARRLEAEVLIDALNWLGGSGETYSSPIPEPFTWIPQDQRTIALADGSITSTFLQTFGRPPRDTGLESERSNQVSDAQRLYLLNSTDIYRRLANGPLLRRVAIAAGGDRIAWIRGIYLTLLTREPLPEELAVAEGYWQSSGLGAEGAAIDLAWALINSMEFLYRH